MASIKEQFTSLSSDSLTDYGSHVVYKHAIVFADSQAAGNTCKRHGSESSSLGIPFDRIINKRNVIIALFIMLILIFMLQTTAVSDGVITTGLALPSAVEQPLRTVQTPAAVRKPAVKPVAQEIEPSNANPDIKESVKATSVSLKSLELASLTPASAPEQADPAIESDTRPNTATTLASIAGAGFIKIADSGEALDDKAEKWECVEDESNNLTWEVKKNDGGIRDKDYLYSWLINVNGENKGVADGGRCKGGVKCDTYSYVRAMNELKLCGYSDWRLPTRKELETLVDLNTTATDATISKMYFPEAVPSWYWTSTENPQRENFAWYILFRNGIALNDLKERPKHIRLVRGNIEQ